jgi:diacylglycerol kinase family enzyme
MREQTGAVYFNPSSGQRLISATELREELPPYLELVEINGDLDVTRDVLRRQGEGQRLFVAAGGDGTVYHVCQPVVNTDSVLGILPLGTFNHLASDLGIPMEWPKALSVAIEGATREVDVGKVNGIYFANNMSLGLYPSMVEKRERLRARHRKWIAYPLALLSTLKNLPRLSMVMEALPHLEVVRTHLFFVAANPYNLSRLGIIAPRESFEAGRLSVYWLPDTSGVRLVQALLRYARGKAATIRKLRRLQTAELIVRSSQPTLRVGMDGEVRELDQPLRISVVNKGLRIRVPSPR